MGKAKVITLAGCIILVTLSAIFYFSGWRINLQMPESSAPTLQEPAQSYG